MPVVDGDGAAAAVVNVLPVDVAGQVSPFSTAVSVGFAGVDGSEVEPSEPFELTLDLSDTALDSAAGNLHERLTVTRFDGCEVFEPADVGERDVSAVAARGEVICESVEMIDADFDAATRTLTALVDVEEIEEVEADRTAALIADGVAAEALDPKAGRERSSEAADVDALAAHGNAESRDLENPGLIEGRSRSSLAAPPVFAQAGGGASGAVFAVTTTVNSSSGDFSALPAPTLIDAAVGLYTGAAETSYPIPVPPAAAGPEPSVALVYSSASVDGMTMGTNNQSGPIGVGWSLAAGGSIQRHLRVCGLSQAPGDRCLSESPDDVYSMSLAGRSSKLVRVDSGGATANPKEFRLEADPFWRIRLWTGNGETNATYNNEWWSVETPDGTVYRLGTSDDSVDWLPVYYENRGGCTVAIDANALCNTARQWNVTTVTDVFGNEMSYEYNQELNHYNARGISTVFSLPYVRASQIETITYGANPTLNSPRKANARIVFNWEQRCRQSSLFGACGTVPNGFHDSPFLSDAPLDLWCGPHAEADEYSTTCAQQTPTFWTLLRLGGALSQVANGNDWVTVAHHDPNQTFVQDNTAEDGDTDLQLVLNAMAERPIDSNEDGGGDSFEFNGFDTLWAKNHSADNGVANSDSHDVGTEETAGPFTDGDWIRFDDVWMGDAGSKATRFTMRVSGVNVGSFEVRADGLNGPLLSTLNINASNFTNGANDYETFNVPIASANRIEGVRDIYVVSRVANAGEEVGKVSFVQFGQPNIGDLPQVGTVLYDNNGATVNSNAWDFQDNRLNHPDGVSAMRFPRIKTITNQLGGQITFTYGQDTPCTFPGEIPPGGWAINDRDCFPQLQPGTGQSVFVIFNKWAVDKVVRTAGAEQPETVIEYEYESPGWGYVDIPDTVNMSTWNEFRGYNIVTAHTVVPDDTVEAGSVETRFHQGLHQERVTSTTTRSVSSVRSDGSTILDVYSKRGLVYETREFGADGEEISRSWSNYRNTATVAGNSARRDPRTTGVVNVRTRVDEAETTRTLYSYNTWGQVRAIREQGDMADGDDNRSTLTRFYPANTGSALGAWRSEMPCVVALRDGNSTATPSSTSASGYVRWAQTFYDGNTNTSCSSVVDEPVPTRSSLATSSTARVTTSYRVDDSGRVDRTTDPNGNQTTIVYNAIHGQILNTTNAKGWQSSVSYDKWRRPTEQVDVNGRRTRTTYDGYSRVKTVRNELALDQGHDTVRYSYDQTQLPSTVRTQTIIDGSNYTDSVVFYDGFGRQVLTRTLAPTVGDNWLTAQRYDEVGRLELTSAQYRLGTDNVLVWDYPNWDSVPSVTETDFDGANRPTAQLVRDGDGDVALESTTTYDGLRTRTVDPNGDWTDTISDGLGRVVQVSHQQGNPDLTTLLEYNAADDLVRTVAPDDAETVVTYDLAGRKTSIDDPDSNGDWSYSYDANSNLLSETDPSGSVTAFTYDNLNRPTYERVDGVVRGRFWYDPSGNLGVLWRTRQYLNVDDVYAQQLFFFDDYGRMDQQRTRIPNANGTGLRSFRNDYEYLANGQVSAMSHPTSTGYAANYDVEYGHNTRTGAQITLSESASSGGQVIVSDVEWAQTGQLYQHRYGSDNTSPKARWNYDEVTLRLVRDRFGINTQVGRDRSNVYSYDGNGNITSIREIRNSSQYQCFAYNQVGRLTDAFTDNTSACDGYTPTGLGNYDDSYSYSRGGNLIEHDGSGDGSQRGDYVYGNGNLEHAVTSISDGSVFSYDDNGNMTVRNLAGQPAQELVWDEGRRLSEVKEGSATVAEFVYMIDDSRVRRVTDDGTATYYLPDGSEYTESAGGNYFTYYHSINGRTVAFTRGDTSHTTWMGSDVVNSTAVTRDEDGVVRTARYTPFGESRAGDGVETDRTFTGQVLDESSGLAFYNARYYDPAIGRFVTPDSIVPDPLNGEDYNRYSYVRNNPIKYSDPSGNEPCRLNNSCTRRHSTGFDGSTPSAPARRVGAPSTSEFTCIGDACDGIGVLPEVSIMQEFADEVLAPILQDQDLFGSVGGCAEGEVSRLGGGQAQGCSMFSVDGIQYVTFSFGAGKSIGQGAAVGTGVVVSGVREPETGVGVVACADVTVADGVGGGGALCAPLVVPEGSGVAQLDFEQYSFEAFVAFGYAQTGSATIQTSYTYVYGDNPLFFLGLSGD